MIRSVVTVALVACMCSAQAQESTVAKSGPACFSVTLQCFGNKPSGLDLTPPPITKLMPQAELRTVLPDPDEPKYDEPLVKVEGERGVPVNVPVGIMSLPWAVRHPTQFWRIFLPSPSRISKDD